MLSQEKNESSPLEMLPTHSRNLTIWERLATICSITVLKANPLLFSVIMGTGVVSALFASFPYGEGTRGMMIASLVVFFLNLALFCVFTALAVAKYIPHPDRWKALVSNPIASLGLGTFPMGLTTLVNVAVDVIFAYFQFGGKPFLYFLWTIWWIVVIISVLCCWITVHAMFVRHQHALSTMTTLLLFPVVTLTVAASSGGVIAIAIQRYSLRHALITVVASVFLVSVGLALALMILTIYFARLVIHGLPSGGSVLTVFFPLGPTGQSGYAIYLLGVNFQQILPYNHAGSSAFLGSSTTGEMLFVICTCSSFILWSLATMWTLFALLAVRSTVRRSAIPFRMTFWGLIFPNGVYANLTIRLGRGFDSDALRIYGSIYAIIVLCLWIYVATRSFFVIKNQIFEEAKSVHRSAGTNPTEIEGADGD